MSSFYDQISRNKLITNFYVVFMYLFTSFVVVVASIIFFGTFDIILVIISLIFSTIITYFLYRGSDQNILKQNNAKLVTKEVDPYIYNITEAISIGAGIPTPKIYIIEERAMNAFAVGKGPGNSSIALTRGLRENLNRAELEGVIAHEISHIKNYDTRLMTIIIGMSIFISMISLFARGFLRFGGASSRSRGSRGKGGGMEIIILVFGLIFLILSPFISKLIQLAISRKREFLADATAVSLTRNPSGLIGALNKIRNTGSAINTADEISSALYISNPLKKGFFSNLTSTHPPIDKRIEELSKSMGYGAEYTNIR